MQSKRKVIVRMRGGLGNQLFCYATARRLSLVTASELVIDDISGFKRDYEYKRVYSLEMFNISTRRATTAERFEPFERLRRGLIKWFSRRREFYRRRYLEEESVTFDSRILSARICGSLYLDGLWQNENYFIDIRETLRNDLQIVPPADKLNEDMAQAISCSNSVAVHIRFFDKPTQSDAYDVSSDYYRRAILLTERELSHPHYYIFSDQPDAARARLRVPQERATYVDHNQDATSSFADLWLMTQCRHHIIANSTFSWWGAWLSEKNASKLTIAPTRHFANPNIVPNRWRSL